MMAYCMDDPLKERLDKLRRHSASVHRMADMYSDVAQMDDRHVAGSLGALNKAPAPGKKLQKIGLAMIWIPEPTFVSCAVGGAMIATGRYFDKKYNGTTITDIGHETKNTIGAIRGFKESVL